MTRKNRTTLALTTIVSHLIVLWALIRWLSGASLEHQLTIIIAVCIVGTIIDLYVFRSLQETTGELGLGANGMVARTGVITEAGGALLKVAIRGETWSARFEGDGQLPVGASVEVVALDGLVLIVRGKDA